MTEREPIVVPPTSERYVTVGDGRCAVSEQEWIAASLDVGELVRITPAKRRGILVEPPAGVAFDARVVGSGFYDGVHLYVEEVRYSMTGDRRTVFPEFGDLIEPLDRSVIHA